MAKRDEIEVGSHWAVTARPRDPEAREAVVIDTEPWILLPTAYTPGGSRYVLQPRLREAYWRTYRARHPHLDEESTREIFNRAYPRNKVAVAIRAPAPIVQRDESYWGLVWSHFQEDRPREEWEWYPAVVPLAWLKVPWETYVAERDEAAYTERRREEERRRVNASRREQWERLSERLRSIGIETPEPSAWGDVSETMPIRLDDLERLLGGDVIRRDDVLRALTIRPCHITGLHDPTHTPRFFCRDQVHEATMGLLAHLGLLNDSRPDRSGRATQEALAKLPRALHEGDGWCTGRDAEQFQDWVLDGPESARLSEEDVLRREVLGDG